MVEDIVGGNVSKDTELKNFAQILPKQDSKKIVLEKFGDLIASDQRSVTVFNRQSTDKGSPIVKSFNLNFDSIAQAVLKVNLLADQGRILSFIPNEFKLTEITLNGFRFIPSDARSSVNVVDKSNDSVLNKILIPKGENQIAVSFDAPIGAGFTSPNAEITAILVVNGNESGLPLVPNTTQITKDITGFIQGNTPLAIALIILFIIGLALVAFIVTKAPPKEIRGLVSDTREIKSEVSG
jgi:hypothetical protein